MKSTIIRLARYNTPVLLFCLSASLVSSCLQEEMLKNPFISYQPQNIDDGWTTSSPSAEGIDAQALTALYEQFHRDDASWQVRSLLVFRNGKLVAESYTKDPADATTPRAIWSCTKQVMGLLTGIALQQGVLGSVNDSIGAYLPEAKQHPNKQAITIRNLLTMQSGIDFENDDLSGQTQALLRQLPDSSLEFILARPMTTTPGTAFRYKDGDPHLLSGVLQRATGKPTREWAHEVLFSKISTHYLAWNQYRDGVTFGAFGILTTPREMAKFGQIVLDSGRWKGTSLVSSAWIQEMTTERIANAFGSQFGYLWWLDKSRSVLFMDGHGGQYVFVVPHKKLLVVMTAEVNTQGRHQFLRQRAFEWVDKIIALAR